MSKTSKELNNGIRSWFKNRKAKVKGVNMWH